MVSSLEKDSSSPMEELSEMGTKLQAEQQKVAVLKKDHTFVVEKLKRADENFKKSHEY